MISTRYAKKYCKDDIANIENYELAVSDKDSLWECHHRRESIYTQQELKEIGEYYNRPAAELIFLPITTHRKKMAGRKKSAQHRKNISKSRIGMVFTDEHRRHLSEAHTGYKWSDEAKAKVSKTRKQLKWYNNGVIQVRTKNCPTGFVAGRLKRK